MARKGGIDKALLEALVRSYAARAKLFHEKVRATPIDLLTMEISQLPCDALEWETKSLGITPSALARVRRSGAPPHTVFAHPGVLAKRPHLIAYYRNLATLSHKGMGQLLFPTQRYESRRSTKMSRPQAARLCRVLNRILCGVIDSFADYRPAVSRDVIMAEIGAEIQGTWANLQGQGATKAVEKVISAYIQTHNLGVKEAAHPYLLTNGWRVVFAAEPDAAFYDAKGLKRIAIEIKGSLDVAGAQTRYGEALKSFRKQLAENPRCHTIYLASCFTDAVIEQIKADGQVRDWYNLTSILLDEGERQRFLEQLFHIVRRPA